MAMGCFWLCVGKSLINECRKRQWFRPQIRPLKSNLSLLEKGDLVTILVSALKAAPWLLLSSAETHPVNLGLFLHRCLDFSDPS